MAPPDSLYFVFLHKGNNSILFDTTDSKGPNLLVEEMTCDFNLSADALGTTPDKFKLRWRMKSSHKLQHDLHALTIHPRSKESKNARYILAFPKPLTLRGESGELFFAHLTTEEFHKRLVDPESSWVHLHFRPSPVSPETDSSLQQSLALTLQHSTNDVLFEFPSTSDNSVSRQLWAQSDKLKTASPYFDSLFSSEGFAETESKIQPPRIDTGASKALQSGTGGGSSTVSKREHAQSNDKEVAPSTMDLDFEDSDMEDDSYPPPASSPPIHRIVVRQVAYRTLFSFLHYLETDNCHFSVLSSLLSDSPSNNRPSSSSSSLPSCSPKSMYRLTDLYEHHDLRQLAYESIQSQLGSNNALFEYFSDLSSDYAEIKGLTMKAVLDNWEAVKESEEMKRIQGELEEGKLEKRKVALLFELFAKLKPASA